MDGIIIIRNLRVQAANAVAGLTWGFPAITQFLGFSHALQRNLPAELKLAFTGCGVICHDHQVQAYRPTEYADYSFALSRNPLNKVGKPSSIVEEGRMNFRASLVLSVEDNTPMGLNEPQTKDLVNYLTEQAQRQRLAGGVVVNMPKVEYFTIETCKKNHKTLMRSLLPGFALLQRHDLLTQRQQEYREQSRENPELHAWLSFASLNYHAHKDSVSDKVHWQTEARPGWLVPITVGYRSISQLYNAGGVKKVRDLNTPVRFVENLYSLGQWMSPHRMSEIEQLLWHYDTTPCGDYLCRNRYAL